MMYGMSARRRRNPGFSVHDFDAFLKSKGLDRLAYLVGKYPDVVEPFLPKIEERLIAKGLLTRAPAADAPLSDREGWTQLAGLVDSALADQPLALREALRSAFLEEAAKAA